MKGNLFWVEFTPRISYLIF